MADICGDNRFEIIKKAKAELLKSTNIETSEDEMKVLDSFLFRCWQMGWLERYEKPIVPLNMPIMTTEFVKEHGLPCPNGYIFKDENGNVINATKIVVEKKKKEYPKTYEECCELLSLGEDGRLYTKGYKASLIQGFQKLLICRDAYWKIAEDEMGLDKPWEPDWDNDEWPDMAYISYDGKSIDKENGFPCCNMILIFPTEEMRDAFYEAFREEIEFVKEFL